MPFKFELKAMFYVKSLMHYMQRIKALTATKSVMSVYPYKGSDFLIWHLYFYFRYYIEIK